MHMCKNAKQPSLCATDLLWGLKYMFEDKSDQTSASSSRQQFASHLRRLLDADHRLNVRAKLQDHSVNLSAHMQQWVNKGVKHLQHFDYAVHDALLNPVGQKVLLKDPPNIVPNQSKDLCLLICFQM